MESTDAEDKNLTYEQLRAKKIARNKALLESLGLGAMGGLNKLAPKPAPKKSAPNSNKKKAKSVKKSENNEDNGVEADSDAENTNEQSESPIRRSSRLAGQDAVKYDLVEPRGVRYRVDDDAGPTRKKQKTVNKSPRPRPTGPKNKENVFGAIPGIPVGTTWEMRMDCSHDGVHRPPVAGIHGNEGIGCYSLALSGGYEDDVDLGHSFTYTGEGGRDLRGTADQPKNLRTAPQSKDQTLTRGNAALALNCDNGKPVRVIRGFKLDSPYAPASGYRYDGLYDVKKYWSETGFSGFLVWKFALVRCPDQDAAPWEEDEGENNNNNNGDDNSEAGDNVDNEDQEESSSEAVQTKKESEKKESEKLGLCISFVLAQRKESIRNKMDQRKNTTKAAKSIHSYSVPITEDILIESKHAPEAIIAALKSLGSWAESTNAAKLDLLKGKAYLPRLVKLLYSENTELLETAVETMMKITARLTFMNDTLRELGALTRINQLVEEPSYNYVHILNLGQVVGNLIKCIPHQIREIGLGLDHETGAYETVFRVKQHDIDRVGVGWRIWDAAIPFSRWIYQKKVIFEKKTVLELGSGPGLSGIVAALHADAVVLSDYIPQLLNTMKENIKLNTPQPIANRNRLYTSLIDFNATERVTVPDLLKDGVDIIIGSEVNYYPEVAKILANAINLYLKTDGVFYGISPTFRGQGNGVLVEEMTQLGFNVELKFPNCPEQLLDDAGEGLTCFTCTRK